MKFVPVIIVLSSALKASAKPFQWQQGKLWPFSCSLERCLNSYIARSFNASCSTAPQNAITDNPKLPDPFHFVDGQAVTTKADWQCRSQEISALIQSLELGIKPDKPTSVTATFMNGTLAITCTKGEKSITFSPKISYPSTGTGPFPAIIAFGGLSIPRPAGVAVITFSNDEIGAQQGESSRNVGKFFDLYGPTGSGAMTAWAWGVSRIIDALESTPDANIDATKVGVTGCSRNGKGALVAGALDNRVALTIPQESGSGGSACWRLSDAENNGGTVQTSSEIVNENVWLNTRFNDFAQGKVSQLPFDHHMLAGLVAPRGLLVIDNIAYEWLGPWSCFECMRAAHKIYEALGVPDNLGISQSPNHQHCAFPDYQQPELDAFVGKFLLGQQTNTSIIKTAGNFTYDESQWIDWTVPTLE